MSTKIEGSVALVTGSNRGIGRALVEKLLERGATKVYATARNTNSLQGLKDEYGDRVEVFALDVTDADQLPRAAAEAGDVQLLFNNAGVAVGGDLLDPGTLDAARQEFEVNVLGSLRTTQAFTPSLRRASGAAVVNIVSIGGLTNFPLFATYSASKAAMHSLTQAQRLLLGADGIQVHGVYPGPVDTDMAKSLEMDKATPGDVADEVLDAIERGDEDVFPDPMAAEFGRVWHSGPKDSERAIAAMVAEMQSQ